MEIDIKIYVKGTSEKPFLGHGPVQLLEKIGNIGSIRKAALQMNMSYSKAHSMILRMEKEVGNSLLERNIGGRGGGGAKLTPAAFELIKGYRRLETGIKQDSGKKFRFLQEKIISIGKNA